MIGGPEVEQIVGVGIVSIGPIRLLLRTLMVVGNPLLQLRQQVGVGGTESLRSPEFVGLGEDGEAILPVLRSIGVAALCEAPVKHVLQILDLAILIFLLVGFVLDKAQSIEQSACPDSPSHDEIALFLAIQYLAEEVAGCNVLRSDDSLHLVNHAVQHQYIPISRVYGAYAVHIETVRVAHTIVDCQFTIVHIRDG